MLEPRKFDSVGAVSWSGAVVWTYSAGSAFYECSPALSASGALFVGNNDGRSESASEALPGCASGEAALRRRPPCSVRAVCGDGGARVEVRDGRILAQHARPLF